MRFKYNKVDSYEVKFNSPRINGRGFNINFRKEKVSVNSQGKEKRERLAGFRRFIEKFHNK